MKLHCEWRVHLTDFHFNGKKPFRDLPVKPKCVPVKVISVPPDSGPKGPLPLSGKIVVTDTTGSIKIHTFQLTSPFRLRIDLEFWIFFNFK